MAQIRAIFAEIQNFLGNCFLSAHTVDCQCQQSPHILAETTTLVYFPLAQKHVSLKNKTYKYRQQVL